jgi:hypothetical protein
VAPVLSHAYNPAGFLLGAIVNSGIVHLWGVVSVSDEMIPAY